MGMELPFDRSLLVIGILSTAEERRDELVDMLVSHFGPVYKITDSVPFSFTDYYDDEMGGNPLRYFIVFENLIDPSTIADIKILTDRLEKEFVKNGGRTFNLDPGILSLNNFILPTTKNNFHRIPIKDGIYCELTLMYRKGTYTALPWTYADYGSPEFIELFNSFRSDLKKLRRKQA